MSKYNEFEAFYETMRRPAEMQNKMAMKMIWNQAYETALKNNPPTVREVVMPTARVYGPSITKELFFQEIKEAVERANRYSGSFMGFVGTLQNIISKYANAEQVASPQNLMHYPEELPNDYFRITAENYYTGAHYDMVPDNKEILGVFIYSPEDYLAGIHPFTEVEGTEDDSEENLIVYTCNGKEITMPRNHPLYMQLEDVAW